MLGPNGAGKTTAFEIITAILPKTSGTVHLDGQPLSRDIPKIFYQTGICSQSNTLWDYLTVEQHLRIYGKIKGMKGVEINETIEYLINALQLDEYVYTGVDKLSGGNKRKLCVAISMMGAPKLLFLDEPSTGMDPVARSRLWGLIKDIMAVKQGSMVLTTHYMQEAELIGDKLGKFDLHILIEILRLFYESVWVHFLKGQSSFSKNPLGLLLNSCFYSNKKKSVQFKKKKKKSNWTFVQILNRILQISFQNLFIIISKY